MVEWSKALVLKTSVFSKNTVGSNPTLSYKYWLNNITGKCVRLQIYQYWFKSNFSLTKVKMIFMLITVLKILSIVVPLLISVAYFTIAERKIMGAIQRRRGPNVIGFIGLLQPLADGLKLFSKEMILPTNANLNIFLLAPSLSFILSLIGWSVIPFSEGIVLCDLNLGILYLLAISSLNVYGILFAG